MQSKYCILSNHSLRYRLHCTTPFCPAHHFNHSGYSFTFSKWSSAYSSVVKALSPISNQFLGPLFPFAALQTKVSVHQNLLNVRHSETSSICFCSNSLRKTPCKRRLSSVLALSGEMWSRLVPPPWWGMKMTMALCSSSAGWPWTSCIHTTWRNLLIPCMSAMVTAHGLAFSLYQFSMWLFSEVWNTLHCLAFAIHRWFMTVQSVQMICSSADTCVSINLWKCTHLLHRQVHLNLSLRAHCIVYGMSCRPLEWVWWIIP